MNDREIEVKYRVEDLARVRKRLAGADGVLATAVTERNHILDTTDRRLLNAGCGLRVRTARNVESGECVVTVTFKGPREPTANGVKARTEIEFTSDDQAACLAILAHLGYQAHIIYEKRREQWKLDDCEVCLDELPLLGCFVEIEGTDATRIRTAARRLELAQIEHRTYVELAAEHGAAGADHVRELRFPSRS